MISNIIVIASAAFGLVFFLAWCCSPSLRRWVERPKHDVVARMQRYDRAHRKHS